MMWQNKFYLVSVMYLGISLLQQPAECQQGEMCINSSIANMQGYRTVLFDNSYYNKFIECLSNKNTRCKAYYYFYEINTPYKVYNIEISNDGPGSNGVYQCIDVYTNYYVLCSIVAGCWTPSTIPCSSSSFYINWSDNKEYFYSETLSNCSFSCGNYLENGMFAYNEILTTTASVMSLKPIFKTSSTTWTDYTSNFYSTENQTTKYSNTETSTEKTTTVIIAVVVTIAIILLVGITLTIIIKRRKIIKKRDRKLSREQYNPSQPVQSTQDYTTYTNTVQASSLDPETGNYSSLENYANLQNDPQEAYAGFITCNKVKKSTTPPFVKNQNSDEYNNVMNKNQLQ